MYNVEIYAGRNFNFRKFPQFKQISKRTYKATGLTEEEAKKLKWKALLNGKKAIYYEDIWDRSSNYRTEYFRKHKDAEFTCVYCGRKLPRSSITIDHVIPIHAVKNSVFLQKYLKKKGYKSINDERNLVHCCWNCNDAKGKQKSLVWSVKAKLGSTDIWWKIRFVIIILTIGALIGLLGVFVYRFIVH